MKNTLFILALVLLAVTSCSKLEDDRVTRIKLSRVLTDKQYDVVYYHEDSNMEYDSLPEAFKLEHLYIDLSKDIFSTNYGSGKIIHKVPQNGIYSIEYHGGNNIRQISISGKITYYQIKIHILKIKKDNIIIKLSEIGIEAIYTLKKVK